MNVSGPIDVDRGTQLYEDLCRAQQSLVVANHLHLLYLVTPYDVVKEFRLSWMMYFQEVSSMIWHFVIAWVSDKPYFVAESSDASFPAFAGILAI